MPCTTLTAKGVTGASAASAEQGARTPSDQVVMRGVDGIGARIAEQLTRAGESMVVRSEFAGPAHAAIIQGQCVTVVDPTVTGCRPPRRVVTRLACGPARA